METNQVIENIKEFCKKSGLSMPQIIAVSKYQKIDKILSIKAANLAYFGENYLNEANRKQQEGAFAGSLLAMTGHVQTNKAAEVARVFDEVHSIHSIKLAGKLNTACAALGKALPIMIQVNIGQELQKSGILVADLPALILYIRENCPNLHLTGLMAIPPAQKDPTPYFKTLKALTAAHNLPHCNMGMSADWPQALLCGATHIRLGTALFGARPTPAA